MPSTAGTFEGQDDVVRFVRYGPWHLDRPSPELDAWIEKHVPRGIPIRGRMIWRDRNADALNARYARTMDAIGDARLTRRNATILLANLIREGEAAAEWKRSGEVDAYNKVRAAEAAFLAQKKAGAHAARTLASLFAERSTLADWTAAFAFMDGMKPVPVPNAEPMDDGSPFMGTPWPFVNWKMPAGCEHADHAPPQAFLAALMHRLADRITGAQGGGYHAHRFGPFFFPKGVTLPNEGQDLFTNGLIFHAVQQARMASGGQKSLDAGRPMPTGGRPLYALAAAYVQDVDAAAHPSWRPTMDAETARQRLSKMLVRSAGVEFRGWARDRDETK